MTLDVGWVVPIVAASFVGSVVMVGYWVLRLSGLRNREQERWETDDE